jgi:Glycosyl hydrolase family 3 N terminal domain
LGSVLIGGNSSPRGKENAPASDWLAEADKFYDASVRPNGNLPIIPTIWGSDAVHGHGHGNVVGATLFPRNIGLGAMRNPQLMRKIGEATAIEMRVTGLDWTSRLRQLSAALLPHPFKHCARPQLIGQHKKTQGVSLGAVPPRPAS